MTFQWKEGISKPLFKTLTVDLLTFALSFSWVYTSDGSAVTWSYWSSTNPNNRAGEDCLGWWENAGPYWHDGFCTSQLKSVCEGGEPCDGCVSCDSGWTMVLGHCYFLMTSSISTFANAVSDCQSRGGKLFEPKSAAINDAVGALMTTSFLIGITDVASEGTWRYESDNQIYTYEKWFKAEPNNAGGNEDCIHVHATTYEWNDVPCGNSYGYVCEGLVFDNP